MAAELVPGVWRLALRGVNSYVAVDGDEVVLIDGGTPWDARAIRDGFDDVGVEMADVDRILLTHYDLDHVGALAQLSTTIDAPVVASEPDASFLTGEQKPPWTNHKGALQRVTALLLDRPSLPVERAADGDEFGSFTAYHTPGHTPGHMVYVSEQLGVAFLGDLVRSTNGGLAASHWFINYDTALLHQSIEQLVAHDLVFDAACPGHGTPLRSDGAVALAALAD